MKQGRDAENVEEEGANDLTYKIGYNQTYMRSWRREGAEVSNLFCVVTGVKKVVVVAEMAKTSPSKEGGDTNDYQG